MTVRVNVSINFEAEDAEAAEAAIAGWKLHEGCQVYPMVTQSVAPLEADAKGALAPVPEPEPEPPPPLEVPSEAEAAELRSPDEA
jgi:hypothetical protein